MSKTQIAEKLESAGCQVNISGDRVYVNSTKNGGRSSYGYCVEAEDVRDITANITKRAGEIKAILRKI